MTEYADILIIGAGPAGISTALNLAARAPTWPRRIVLIDAAVHPRDKLCGGGITHLGSQILERMGLRIEPDNLAIREVILRWRSESVYFRGDPVLCIVRRRHFDHWLLEKARAAGVRIREGERVLDFTSHDSHVEVRTSAATFHAGVVVGADGSRSMVRKHLGWLNSKSSARMLEVLTEPTKSEKEWFDKGVATFDLNVRDQGVNGYGWDFPTIVDGKKLISRGVFDGIRRGPPARLPAVLAQMAARRGIELPKRLESHPIRMFDPKGAISTDRIILVGDAAGVDPLFGEGISFALAYGEVAAESIDQAFTRRDFSFRKYRRQVLRHRLLGQLPGRVRLAHLGTTTTARPFFTKVAMRGLGAVVAGSNWSKPSHDPVATKQWLLRA
ncbi:MAG: geranylgeranyl reductase family protein [Myxococcales bacterium]|nr:geranylgeranyl reductase family protein [Myxococcales bacterium]